MSLAALSVKWYHPESVMPPRNSADTSWVSGSAIIAGTLPAVRRRGAVAFLDRFPLAFIIDMRGLSLAARHMDRATTSGLDITRRQLLTAIDAAAEVGRASGPWLLVNDGR